jgi:hypothetical protein
MLPNPLTPSPCHPEPFVSVRINSAKGLGVWSLLPPLSEILRHFVPQNDIKVKLLLDSFNLSHVYAQEVWPDHDAQDNFPPYQMSEADGEKPAGKPENTEKPA